jgi:hypothetical protein
VIIWLFEQPSARSLRISGSPYRRIPILAAYRVSVAMRKSGGPIYPFGYAEPGKERIDDTPPPNTEIAHTQTHLAKLSRIFLQCTPKASPTLAIPSWH